MIAAMKATTAEQAAAERQAANNSHTFTLTFRRGELAILEVRGAADQETARAIAGSAFSNCQYTITDGDQTNGRAEYFYSWCREAQA
jgi:hypothetical protein